MLRSPAPAAVLAAGACDAGIAKPRNAAGPASLLVGLRPFAFLDFGEAFDSTDTGLGFASSIGVGISFVAGQVAFGDIYVAKPLSTGIAGWANPSKAAVVGASLSIRF